MGGYTFPVRSKSPIPTKPGEAITTVPLIVGKILFIVSTTELSKGR